MEIDPNTDLLVRTVIGEAADQPTEGQQGVAAVAMNRARKSGKSIHEVLLSPNQFQAWQDPALRKRMTDISQDDPEYQTVLSNIAPVVSGQANPVGSADHYLNKATTPAGSESLKTWAAGPGHQIGAHTFYSVDGGAADTPKGPSEAEIDRMVGAPAPTGPQPSTELSDADLDRLITGGAAEAPKDPGVFNAKTGQPWNDAQAKTLRDLQASGRISTGDGKPTTLDGRPLFASADGAAPAIPGAYYVDPTGALQQVPDNPHYNGGVNFANAGLLGHGNQLMAGVQAAKATAGDLLNGGDLSGAGNRLVDYYHQAKGTYDQAQADYGVEHPVAAPVGQLAGTMTTLLPAMAAGGELAAPVLASAGPVGEFVSGASAGNRLITGASRITSGALQGGIAGAAASGESPEPFGQQVAQGALTGGAFSAAAPVAAAAARSVNNALFEPGVIPAVKNLADLAVHKYGIPLRVGQIKGVTDRGAALADSESIGKVLTGAAGNHATQLGAFTKAIAGTFGSDAEALTPEVMQQAKTRIGGEFERVAQGTTITNTNHLQSELDRVVSDAQQVLPDSDAAPLLKQVENIKTTIKNGVLSGDSYQALMRNNSPLDRATESANPNIRHYAQELRGVLDDALTAAATPEDAQALRTARWQYKNLMTMKNLANKANVSGEISPALLNGAVNTSFKNRAFSGAGDLGELAQIGQTFMREPSNSNTAGRLVNKLAPYLLGGAGASDIGLAFQDPALAGKLALGAAAAGTARLGAQAIGGAYNRSPLVRNLLLNGVPLPPAVAAAAQRGGALLNNASPAYVPLAAVGVNQLMGASAAP